MTHPHPHSHSLSDDDGLNAEDLKFFKKRAKFLGSLSTFADTDLSANVNRKNKNKNAKQPGALDALEAAEDAQATALKKMQSSWQNGGADDEDDESEEDELDRRMNKKARSLESHEEEQKQLGLPVKSVTGEWKRQTVKIKSAVTRGSEDTEDTKDTKETGNDGETVDLQTITPVPSAPSTLTFSVGKERLALIAMEITEDIEENVGKLKELLKYTRPGMIRGTRDEEVEMVRIGLITAIAVFKDILPGYSIRPLTEAERQAKVSKDVKKQRVFEETLLRSYNQYVERLDEILKTVKKGDAGVVPIAIGCLGELAVSAGHFNFYERILASLCGQVFNGKEETALVAISAVNKVFAEDEIGRSTAHALRLLSDAIQARDYLPELRCLAVLQHVRVKLLAYSRTDALPSEKKIASEEAARLDLYKKKSQHMSKSQKKNLKAELAESIKNARAEAEFSREERSKWSSDALKFQFRILFGILKRCLDPQVKSRAVKLLPEVMKSLSKCAQFLSSEYFTDLLSTLKKTISLIESEQSIPATLHTVQTVLQIVSLQETSKVTIVSSSSLVDLKFYYDLIYRQIPGLNSITWSKEFEGLLEGVMSKLFLSKKHCPSVRVASFIHRFADLILNKNLDIQGKLYVLRLILRLIERHEKCRGLLDEETLGVAAYLPTCPDPDLSNPFCKQLDMDSIVKRIQQEGAGKVPNDILGQIRRIKSTQ